MTDKSAEPPKIFPCPIFSEFGEYRKESKVAMEQVNGLTRSMSHVMENTDHLIKLDSIADSIKIMIGTLQDVREGLLNAAIGKDQVPRATAELMFNQQAKSNAFVCRVLGVVITGLLFVIGFLLTGDKAELIKPLHYFTSEK